MKSFLRKVMNNEKDEEIQADFLCDICGAIACHVSIKQMGEHKYICHSGFDGTSEMIIQSDQYRSVCKTLKQKNVHLLHKLDPMFAPFLCTECNLTYCYKHWHFENVFDDGFYDCCYGTCPQGHRRMVDD